MPTTLMLVGYPSPPRRDACILASVVATIVYELALFKLGGGTQQQKSELSSHLLVGHLRLSLCHSINLQRQQLLKQTARPW